MQNCFALPQLNSSGVSHRHVTAVGRPPVSLSCETRPRESFMYQAIYRYSIPIPLPASLFIFCNLTLPKPYCRCLARTSLSRMPCRDTASRSTPMVSMLNQLTYRGLNNTSTIFVVSSYLSTHPSSWTRHPTRICHPLKPPRTCHPKRFAILSPPNPFP